MSLYLKLGLWIFIPSALVALVNAWAFRAFPEHWGGPNIGGGGIQLIAYTGMLLGAALVVVAIVGKRRKRRPGSTA